MKTVAKIAAAALAGLTFGVSPAAAQKLTFTLNWVNHSPVLTVTPIGTTIPVPPGQPLIVANLTTPAGQPSLGTAAPRSRCGQGGRRPRGTGGPYGGNIPFAIASLLP